MGQKRIHHLAFAGLLLPCGAIVLAIGRGETMFSVIQAF
jgi:hypothetical protein